MILLGSFACAVAIDYCYGARVVVEEHILYTHDTYYRWVIGGLQRGMAVVFPDYTPKTLYERFMMFIRYSQQMLYEDKHNIYAALGSTLVSIIVSAMAYMQWFEATTLLINAVIVAITGVVMSGSWTGVTNYSYYTRFANLNIGMDVNSYITSLASDNDETSYFMRQSYALHFMLIAITFAILVKLKGFSVHTLLISIAMHSISTHFMPMFTYGELIVLEVGEVTREWVATVSVIRYILDRWLMSCLILLWPQICSSWILDWELNIPKHLPNSPTVRAIVEQTKVDEIITTKAELYEVLSRGQNVKFIQPDYTILGGSLSDGNVLFTRDAQVHTVKANGHTNSYNPLKVDGEVMIISNESRIFPRTIVVLTETSVSDGTLTTYMMPIKAFAGKLDHPNEIKDQVLSYMNVNALAISDNYNSKHILRVAIPASMETYTVEAESLDALHQRVKQAESVTSYAIGNTMSSYYQQGRAPTFAPMLRDVVSCWDDILKNRVFYAIKVGKKEDTKSGPVTMPAPSAPDNDDTIDMDNPPKPTYIVKGNKINPDTQRYNDSMYTAQFTGNFSTINMPRGHVITEWKPTMHQCFPQVLNSFITAPVKGPGWVVEESVLGRMYGSNKDDDQLTAQAAAIDWKVIDGIVKTSFPKLMKYAGDHFETVVQNIPKLKTRWENSREIREFAEADEFAYLEFDKFVKTEAQTGKNPLDVIVRQIMNDSDTAVLEASPYTKVLSKWCSANCGWYAFGKHTSINQDRIHHMARTYPLVSENDFSSYDGTQNSLTQMIEIMVYDHVFADGQITSLKYQSLHSKVGKQHKADTLGTRHSGEAATSLMNTIVNYVLCMYALLTFDRKNATLAEAQGQVIAGGDDSLVYFKDPLMAKKFEDTMAEFGLTLKAKALPSTSPVSFLAMVYPNAVAGPHVMPDFERVLNKLVLCSTAHDSIHGCAHKLNGYLTMYPEAYLLSDMFRLYLAQLAPYIDERFLKVINDPASLPYAMRMGSPLLCVEQSDSLQGQNLDAVVAVQGIISALKARHVFQLGLDLNKGVTNVDPMTPGYQNKAIMKMNQVAIDRSPVFKVDTILSEDAVHVTSKRNLDAFVDSIVKKFPVPDRVQVVEDHPNLITSAIMARRVVLLRSQEGDRYTPNVNLTILTDTAPRLDPVIDLRLGKTLIDFKATDFQAMYLVDVLSNYESLKDLNAFCICEGQLIVTKHKIGKPISSYNPTSTNAPANTHCLHNGTTKIKFENLAAVVLPAATQRLAKHVASKACQAKGTTTTKGFKNPNPTVKP